MPTQEAIDWIRNRWIPALRSGEYRQGKSRLRSKDNRYCCLGVACDLAAAEGMIPGWIDAGSHYAIPLPAFGAGEAYALLPDTLGTWLGFGNWGEIDLHVAGARYTFLTSANDDDVRFDQIADALEAWCAEQEALLCQPNP